MAEVTRSESLSGSSARAPQRSERGNPRRRSSILALQRLARDGALPPAVTPETARVLQRAVGNRATARLARQPARRMLQRSGSGKIIAGTFAASVGGDEKVIQVIPWTDRNGRNNNFLYID